MKKTELLHLIATTSGESRATVERVLSHFTSVVKDAVLLEGDKVSLPGFGVFSKRVRKGRPFAGKAVPGQELPDTESVAFRAFADAKQKLD